MQPWEMAMPCVVTELTNDEIFDSIGLQNATASNAAAGEAAPQAFEEVDPEDYTLFDSAENQADSNDDYIDWEDYLFEAITQFSAEPPPPNLAKRHRVIHATDPWYPFKSKGVR
ncbi:hypothetical protein PCANC_19309 [Puccinia coronata f. sp. avenae]|uniref:Uncharacterized protein n=1 Tax=Puccinia coronata f. sp. avenae TaxID=200324 RepID=A0A2N5ULX0_9BASI|nr:hypothetical protein PCANC_19309 [Puccinia coronata f. sp. avenae]